MAAPHACTVLQRLGGGVKKINVCWRVIATKTKILELSELSGAIDVRYFNLFVIELILGGSRHVAGPSSGSVNPLCLYPPFSLGEESDKEDSLVKHYTCSQDSLSDVEFDENILIQLTLNGPVRGFRQKSAASSSDVDVFLGVSIY